MSSGELGILTRAAESVVVGGSFLSYSTSVCLSHLTIRYIHARLFLLASSGIGSSVANSARTASVLTWFPVGLAFRFDLLALPAVPVAATTLISSELVIAGEIFGLRCVGLLHLCKSLISPPPL